MNKKRLVIKQTNPWGILLIILFALAFLMGIALLAFSKGTAGIDKIVFSSKENFIFYEASSTKQLKKELHLYGLCSAYSYSVKPYLLKRFPKDFRYLSAKTRKKMFVAAMLPIALTVKEQFDQEHKLIMGIKEKIDSGMSLDDQEKAFLKSSKEKYKADNIDELAKRINSVPVSLLIAQAGIESGWGKSRFTTLYNNIYGLHKKHAKPYQPIVMSFTNLYDATVFYMMNLNTSLSYKKFRDIRYLMYPMQNPYKLSEYLTMYSTKRHEYIRLVQRVLSSNKLSKYDSYSIQQIVVMNYSIDNDIQ